MCQRVHTGVVGAGVRGLTEVGDELRGHRGRQRVPPLDLHCDEPEVEVLLAWVPAVPED